MLDGDGRVAEEEEVTLQECRQIRTSQCRKSLSLSLSVTRNNRTFSQRFISVFLHRFITFFVTGRLIFRLFVLSCVSPWFI